MRNILRWFWRNLRPKQTTFVSCPFCGVEQIANLCFVEETGLVMYLCWRCGTCTRWDFAAPVPLLRFFRVNPGDEWEPA